MKEFIEDSRCSILAYDLSITDINERKRQVIEFATLKLAEQKLNVGYQVLKRVLKNKGRVYSDLYDKEFALRIKPTQNETSI